MAKVNLHIQTYEKKDVQRKGVHSKSKTSTSKTSKNYKKAYRGQGR